MILKDAQCTNYRLQSILEWAFNAAQSMGFDFNPTEIKRRTNVQWMYQALRNLHQRLSQVMLVNLEDHNNIQDVICFDFATSLLLLPQDNNLMQPENLVVNLDNPTSMYMPSEKKYGEAHTDKRYCMLFQELITSTKQLLVPIIVYLDGTAIDSTGHIEVCSVSFTTSLLFGEGAQHITFTASWM
jgi:hypothetical protein